MTVTRLDLERAEAEQEIARLSRIIERLREEIAMTLNDDAERWASVRARLKAALAYHGRE